MRAATVIQRRRLTRVLPANDDGVVAPAQGVEAPSTAFSGASAALPPQLDFLLAHGLTRAMLRPAATLATRWRVAPEQALFSAQIMEPARYYRALAQELGAPFVDDALRRGQFALDASARFPESVVAGVVAARALSDQPIPADRSEFALPGDGALSDQPVPADRSEFVPPGNTAGERVFLMAPQGVMLARLLDRRMAAANMAIVTPAALEAAVMRRHGPAIALAAGHALADSRPDLSCRDGLSPAQARWFAGVVLALMGLAIIAPIIPAIVFALAFLSYAVVRLAATFAPAPGAPPPPPVADADLPVYTVIVPVYGEANMVGHILEQLERLDYPRARLDVKIVVEADDHPTRTAFIVRQPPSWINIVVAPSGAPRTKPRALNVALAAARGAFTTIYDAEDAPDPDQLRKAVATFRAATPDIACLQARLVIDNSADGWLPACFALEYAALFDAVNPGLARLGLPVPLGGTSNHFRTNTLRQLMGWDAWNVTEDADLGVRLARAGWGVADLDSATLEEAPVTTRAWLAQRTRWLKGWMQVAVTHSRHPVQTVRELGLAGAWAVAAQTLGVLLGALGYPFFVVIAGVQLASGNLFRAGDWQALLGATTASAVLLAGVGAGLAPLLAGARRRRIMPLLALAPLMPVYYLLVSLAAWRALVEQIRHPARWNKTRHGVARSSRSGRLTYTSGTQQQPPPADA